MMRDPTNSKDSACRVVLIAGLDDGLMAARYLLDHPRSEVVGLFVLDETAGSGVSGFRSFDDLAQPPILRKISRIGDEVENIQSLKPDVVFVVGFSQIIPGEILSIPRLGTIGFHSARLPDRRGSSPIIWAIIDGLSETAVTMFYLDEGIDTGDIIATKAIPINEEDQAADVLKRADRATLALLREHADEVFDGMAQRTSQRDAQSIYTRRRTPADGEIDWSLPASQIVNQVRALSPPYPMAHTFGGDGIPILIEAARLAPDASLPPAQHLLKSLLQKRVLCVVSHPDDEVLGIGGTLARHADAGGEVVVLILSEGEKEKLEGTPRSLTRRESALQAAEILGTSEVVFCDYPDQRLDAVEFVDLIKPIESAVSRFSPEVVYTHHGGDANTDHQTTFKATYAACRPMSQMGSSVERLLTFETPSSTDQAPQVGDYVFSPNSFVDVEPVWTKKIEALKCYPTEMIGGIHPRSYEYIEALARMRGGYAGLSLAEAFVIVRERVIV
jgi:methionyl-tRNA formyltransferase